MLLYSEVDAGIFEQTLNVWICIFQKMVIMSNLEIDLGPLKFLLKIWDPFFCPKILDPLKKLRAGIPHW